MHKSPLVTTGCGDGFIDYLGDDLTLYDDFYIDRYHIARYSYMYEKINARNTSFGSKALRAITQDSIDEWREMVLQSGCGSFKYDW